MYLFYRTSCPSRSYPSCFHSEEKTLSSNVLTRSPNMSPLAARIWIRVNYFGQFALSAYAVSIFHFLINELNNHTNFVYWNNAWKYRLGIVICLALSSLSAIISVLGVLCTPFIQRKGDGAVRSFIWVLNFLHMLVCLPVMLGLYIASLSITCDLKEEHYKNACLYYFSWTNVFLGLALQFLVSIVVPFWVCVITLYFLAEDEDEETESVVDTESPYL